MEQIINAIPPTKQNSEVRMKEMEIELLGKFLSSTRQKTQVTSDERILIGVLDGYARNPYPISQDICRRLKIPFSLEDFRLDFLEDFLKCFIEYGIPLDRNGRSEEVKVLTSYFMAQHEEQNQDKKINTLSTKLMK